MVHEIKSAIILAAGRGKRLGSLTDETPKSLLKVKDEVLIERLIRQLQEKGIEEIYVVTGYKHWLFRYLEDKFDVTLVYNKKWFCTNNIVSFIKAYEARSKYINNFATIMLDADLYIADTSIIQTKIDVSGYYVEYSVDENVLAQEWVVKMCGAENQRITDVICKGSKKTGYILRSLSVWTPMDIRRMYDYAKKSIANGDNMQCYIDDIPCRLFFNAFTLKPYIGKSGALLEIDTELDYSVANKENDNEKNS